MADLEAFEDIFPSGVSSYTAQRVDSGVRHRKELKNVLFFDRLLQSVGVDEPSKVYPPKSSGDLKKLYTRISQSASPLHHKQSLMYYILLDLHDGNMRDGVVRDGGGEDEETGPPAKYSVAVGLPSKYVTLMQGLWLMDQISFKRALNKLTEPSLIPTFPEQTLEVLCDHPKSDDSFVLAFYHTVSPELQDRTVLDKVFRCMTMSSVTEAFFYSRQQGGSMHRHLFTKLISNVLSHSGGETKAQMAEELVTLPFNEEEDKWFQEYLLTGDGSGLPQSRDTVVMRLITKGKLQEATSLATSAKNMPIVGLGWLSLLKAA